MTVVPAERDVAHDRVAVPGVGVSTDKFAVPPLPATYVERPRLAAALSGLTTRRLTIVTGAIGGGKTTLLAAFAHARPRGSIAWCTLDQDDSDHNVLAASILRAVLVARTADGKDEIATVRSVSPDPLDQAMELAAHGDDLVLVLDDVERLSSRDARAALQRLVQIAPPTLSIVLATRHDPDFHPRRFRGEQPGSLRASELAFTAAEAAALFARYDVDVTDEDVALLTTWTEGSAAALQLVAVLLRSGDRDSVLEEARLGERTVIDFLFHGVLDALPLELREFVVRTSIVDAIDADLAHALVPGAEAARLLAAAAAQQLLIASPGPAETGGETSYHHHNLLADLLRATLQHEYPDEVTVLHARAAHWFEATGCHDEATRHAAAAGEWSVVARAIVDTWVASLLAGRRMPAPVLAFRLPVVDTENDATYALALAIGCFEHDDHKQATSLAVRASLDDDPRLRFIGALLALQVACEGEGESSQIDRAADVAMAAAIDGCTSALEHDRVALLVLVARAQARLRDGDLDAARELLECVVDTAPSDADAVTAIAIATLSLTEAIRGRLRRAVALTDEVGEIWLDPTAAQVRGLRSLTLAIASYHADDVANARAAVGEAREHLRGGVFRDVVLAAVGARVTKADGDKDATRRQLAHVTGARCRPLAEILGDALALSELAPRSAERGRPDAFGSTHTVHPYVVTFAHVSAATDAFSRRDYDAARAEIQCALELIDRHGYRRAFLDSGLPVRELLVDYVTDVRPFRMLATQLLERMWIEGDPAPGLVERLTERELTVLRYLPTMMSNSEIAGEMYFSVNTVKTHLKSIYRKLDVTRRREAVDRARDLSLI